MRKEDKPVRKEARGLTFESLDQSLCCVYIDAEGKTEFAAEGGAFYKCWPGDLAGVPFFAA
jgi:hypothetical protein